MGGKPERDSFSSSDGHCRGRVRISAIPTHFAQAFARLGDGGVVSSTYRWYFSSDTPLAIPYFAYEIDSHMT